MGRRKKEQEPKRTQAKRKKLTTLESIDQRTSSRQNKVGIDLVDPHSRPPRDDESATLDERLVRLKALDDKHKPVTPEPDHNDDDDDDELLLRRQQGTSSQLSSLLRFLGGRLHAELAAWLTHMHSVLSISSAEAELDDRRVALLSSVLRSGPGRQRALLLTSGGAEEEEEPVLIAGTSVDVKSWYVAVSARTKDKICSEAGRVRRETRTLEEMRLEQLKEVLVMYEELNLLEEGGYLGDAEVGMLVQAMVDVGLGIKSIAEGLEVDGLWVEV